MTLFFDSTAHADLIREPGTVSPALLDEAVARFPRVVAECARYELDAVRRLFLTSEPHTVAAIVHEYRMIAEGMP